MSFTHRIVLPLAGIAAALSMITIGLAAEPAPAAPDAPTGLPTACQLRDEVSSTKTPTTTVTPTSTPTSKVASDDEENDDVFAMRSDHSEAVRACIEALRAEGHHGFGEIIRTIARANAERDGHERDGHERDDDTASASRTATTTVTVTPTATATATAEHHGHHGPPTTHPRG